LITLLKRRDSWVYLIEVETIGPVKLFLFRYLRRRWNRREREYGKKDVIAEMVADQVNEGGLESVEVVVLQDNSEEVNLETQGVKSGTGGFVVQGKAQVVCHPRWRREVLTELTRRRLT